MANLFWILEDHETHLISPLFHQETPIRVPLNQPIRGLKFHHDNELSQSISPQALLIDGYKNKKRRNTETLSIQNSFPIEPKRRKSSSDIFSPIACPHCDCIFNRQYNLKSHMKIHSGEKPFQCDQCGLAFSRNHDLKRHVKIHNGLKLFNCIYCQKSFSRNDALVRHYSSKKCQSKINV